MKIFITAKAKKIDSPNKKRLKKYWKYIYPKKYVDILVSKEQLENFVKNAKKQNVELIGKLKKTKDNFVYIDIPDELMNGLFNLIEDKGEKPPYNQKSFNNVGSHISVIKIDEFNDNNLNNIKEIGKEFSFQLGELKSLNPYGWDEMDKVWFLTVISPELENLRKKYKLTPKIDNHEFHITIQVKEK